MSTKPTLPPSFMRPKDVCALLGVGRTKLYFLSELEPSFPKKVVLGKRCVGWRRESIEAWLLAKEREASE